MNTSLFSLNTASGVPIYRQLTDQIKQAIYMNLLQPDEQLPSVRKLAALLQINPMTVSKAYAQLEMEGVLQRKRGIGMLVTQQQNHLAVPDSLHKTVISFIHSAHKAGLDDEQIMALTQQYLSLVNHKKDPTS